MVQSIASVVNRRWKTCLLEENRLKTEWKQRRNQEGLSRRYRSAGGGGPVVTAFDEEDDLRLFVEHRLKTEWKA